MGEFGVMSRILAPKFGGFLTFASLREEANTAPGQITIEELLNLYRFRSITPTTKVYGIIGWPVTQSMSPMVHNAGFQIIGWDGVYVPMPVEGSYESFKATMLAMIDSPLDFTGASVTIPHKEHLFNIVDRKTTSDIWCTDDFSTNCGTANTFARHLGFDETDIYENSIHNTDSSAILSLLGGIHSEFSKMSICVYGSGGVAKAAVYSFCDRGASIDLRYRSLKPAENIKQSIESLEGTICIHSIEESPRSDSQLYINCTPVGMTDGPDPDGLSIPIPDMDNLAPETVFFDTVYNPIETPMIKAAKEHGYRTIDGVQMFVKQAEAQFEIWTSQSAPEGLFDSLVRTKLNWEPSNELICLLKISLAFRFDDRTPHGRSHGTSCSSLHRDARTHAVPHIPLDF